MVPIIAVALAVSMTPGALEMIENAAHLLGHGDTAHASAAHASAEHGESGESDEHGCSGTYHACACHASPHFADSATAVKLPARLSHARSASFAASALLDSGVIAAIDRPPQA